jgi:hypothetical protein
LRQGKLLIAILHSKRPAPGKYRRGLFVGSAYAPDQHPRLIAGIG